MKPIEILLNLEARFHKITQNNDLISKASLPIGILILMSEVIWLAGPHFNIAGYMPLITPEKRIYVIAALFLAWLLKFLLVDLETPTPLQFKDIKTRKKITNLENRFKGAMDFLKKVPLHQTPWIFLLGPRNAGKTTLLANSSVPFILQKQFAQEDIHQIPPSENCDWWVTRDACIIDVPSIYVSTKNKKDQQTYRTLWHYFLKMVAKYRGKNGVNGVIIALPVMDILKYQREQYQQMLKDIFQRIFNLQQGRLESLPCQIVFTKCDLIPGFKEFFSEASLEETEQAWGIHLSPLKPNEKLADQVHSRFNALIKKINQQLLWRIHHERNPMARPYIKDFPLQLEQVKELLLDFSKRFASAKLNAHINSIYLTSAIQPKEQEKSTILDESANDTTKTIQLFNHHLQLSRPFFIKQMLQHGLNYTAHEPAYQYRSHPWQTRFAYAASITLIIISGVFLGRDFQSGLQHTYVLQKDISDFQLRVAKMQDPIDHLIETISLLNTLKPESFNNQSRFSLKSITAFYTTKSEQKGKEVYLTTLHTILLSEIKSFFEEYLKNPINKDADDVYAVLKAYLMLGDATYLNVDHIKNITSKILPKTLMETEYNDLMSHLNIALNTTWQPLTLNNETLVDTRRYMASLPKLKMGYIILKNIDNNNLLQEIELGDTLQSSTFTTQQLSPQIPLMFTAKSFSTIINQETTLSAQQAVAGNWILGHGKGFDHDPNLARGLTEQLRNTYLNNYIDVWESLLANITLTNATTLSDIDNILLSMVSEPSPLVQLLQTIHQNTYFEPVISASPRLQALGNLINNSPKSQRQFSEIIDSLRALHFYIQPTVNTSNSQRAAYELMVKRTQARGIPDAITQARLVANKSPEPLKTWLTNVADLVANLLLTESGRYIDTSWQTNVMQFYQMDIANRYPFGGTDNGDVDVEKFKKFFGNPGILISYFNQYLKPLIDISNNTEWRWKSVDNKSLPFSEDTLRQIQLAMRIHKSFFPNNDDKLHVQFTLQPYELGKLIKSVTLKINDKQYVDDQDSASNSHIFAWPGNNPSSDTYVKLTLDNDQHYNQRYPGEWGWFKMISQGFESVVSKKELLLNLSRNEHPAKYRLFIDGKYNPFSTLDLKHFHLPQQLTEEKS